MGSKPARSFWQWIERLANIAGIVALGMAVFALFKVRDLNDIVQAAATRWTALTVAIDVPIDGATIEGHFADIVGRVTLEPNAGARVSSVRLKLVANNIALVPMVRPIAEPLRWWPQPDPAVADDGVYRATLRLGREEVVDVGQYDLVVLAMPTNGIARTETYGELPPHYAQSNTIRITRK